MHFESAFYTSFENFKGSKDAKTFFATILGCCNDGKALPPKKLESDSQLGSLDNSTVQLKGSERLKNLANNTCRRSSPTSFQEFSF